MKPHLNEGSENLSDFMVCLLDLLWKTWTCSRPGLVWINWALWWFMAQSVRQRQAVTIMCAGNVFLQEHLEERPASFPKPTSNFPKISEFSLKLSVIQVNLLNQTRHFCRADCVFFSLSPKPR